MDNELLRHPTTRYNCRLALTSSEVRSLIQREVLIGQQIHDVVQYDERREAEAFEWSGAVLQDMSDEPR